MYYFFIVIYFLFCRLQWLGQHQPSKELLEARPARPGPGPGDRARLGPWAFLKHYLAWLMLSEPLESEISLILLYFLPDVAAIAAKKCDKEAVNKSAASAASPEMGEG